MAKIRVKKVIQSGKREFVVVFDNGEEIALHEDLLVRYRLIPGKEADPGLLSELAQGMEMQQAYSLALAFLSCRPRSCREVEEYLSRKGFGAQISGQVLNRLLQEGYLDDLRFARLWVRHRMGQRPKGRVAIRAELAQKGIDGPLAERVLQEMDREEEKRQALGLGLKRMERWLDQDWKEVNPRLGRYLSARGYDAGLVLEVLSELKEEFRRRKLDNHGGQ